MSGDPLGRDVFGDRPDHPDFWRLAEVVLAIDARAAEDGKTVPEIVADIIDVAVLEYVARHRTGTAARLLGLPDLLAPALRAAWLDAFVAGARFAMGHSQRREVSP